MDRHDVLSLICIAFHTNHNKPQLTEEEFTTHIQEFCDDLLFSTCHDMFLDVPDKYAVRNKGHISLTEEGKNFVFDFIMRG